MSALLLLASCGEGTDPGPLIRDAGATRDDDLQPARTEPSGPADDPRAPAAPVCAYAHTFQNVTHYELGRPYRVTPRGVRLDDPGHQLDDAAVDRLTAELETCLAALPARWSDEERLGGSCLSDVVERSLPPACLQVRVADDWRISACSGEQVFACSVDPRVCLDKGQELSERCPCACRATLQDGWIVVTPNLALYKAELARLVTGCNNPWRTALASCL